MSQNGTPGAAEGLPITIGVTSIQGGRSNNEDSFLVVDPTDGALLAHRGRLVVVADGMGGAAGGEKASKLVVETIRDAYFGDDDPSVPGALRRALERANQAIFGYAQSHPELKGMGSTCVAIAVHRGLAWVAHVGDSRAYLMREGQLYPLTRDHTKVNQMVADGFLQEAEAQVHPEKHVLNRSMGPNPDVRVELIAEPVPLLDGDRLLLCSDGLSDAVHESEIAWYADHYPAQRATEAVCDFVMARHNALVARGEREPHQQDNTTVQVVQVGTFVAAASTDPAPQIASAAAPATMIVELPSQAQLTTPASPPTSAEPPTPSTIITWVLGGLVALLTIVLIVVLATRGDKSEPQKSKKKDNAGEKVKSDVGEGARTVHPEDKMKLERPPVPKPDAEEERAKPTPDDEPDAGVAPKVEPEKEPVIEPPVPVLSEAVQFLKTQYAKGGTCRDELQAVFERIHKDKIEDVPNGEDSMLILAEAEKHGWTGEVLENVTLLVGGVERFQRKLGVKVDGLPGDDTIDKAGGLPTPCLAPKTWVRVNDPNLFDKLVFVIEAWAHEATTWKTASEHCKSQGLALPTRVQRQVATRLIEAIDGERLEWTLDEEDRKRAFVVRGTTAEGEKITKKSRNHTFRCVKVEVPAP